MHAMKSEKKVIWNTQLAAETWAAEISDNRSEVRGGGSTFAEACTSEHDVGFGQSM